MSPLVKLLLPLAVALPLVGYVAGSLASAGDDEPPPRTPIELRNDDTTDPTRSPSSRPTGDDGDGRNDGGDGGDGGNDGHVITPSPYDDDGVDVSDDTSGGGARDDGAGHDGDDGGDDGDD
jgi:hypothetical protein